MHRRGIQIGGQFMDIRIRFYVALACCLALVPKPCPAATAPSDPLFQPAGAPNHGPYAHAREVFTEVESLVREKFYDADLHGLDWANACDEFRPRALEARDPEALSLVINQLLAKLNASHTGHYTSSRREYYELLDVFYPDGMPKEQARKAGLDGDPVTYVGIGLATRDIEGRTIVYDVYPGGPAAKAGIREGDSLLGVDDGPWGDTRPFRGKNGKTCHVRLMRSADPDKVEVVSVTPQTIQPRKVFERAIRLSADVVEKEGVKLAYVRVRSYASPVYQKTLVDLIGNRFADADGLVLDLRGGWGGANPSYLDVFNPLTPTFSARRRGGSWENAYPPAWHRPLVVLTDGGTRSGKELLTHAFKTRGTATIVGEPTAGAVLGGNVTILSDGSLLLLAVSDVLVDGVRLEGNPVTPDVPVGRELPFSNGADPQREKATEVLIEKVKKQS